MRERERERVEINGENSSGKYRPSKNLSNAHVLCFIFIFYYAGCVVVFIIAIRAQLLLLTENSSLVKIPLFPYPTMCSVQTSELRGERAREGGREERARDMERKIELE